MTRGLALTLLHCDKVCVFTQVAHIAAAPITFALWALIVSSDNGLNGSSEINAAGRLGVAKLVPPHRCVRGAEVVGDFRTDAGHSDDKAVVDCRAGRDGIRARRLLDPDRGYAGGRAAGWRARASEGSRWLSTGA